MRQYNDTGTLLMRFELGVQENWKNLRIHQIELMVSKSIFQDSGLSGSLESNFDPDFYTFMKENERLAKMDIAIPSVNQFLIKRKEYFSQYGDAVDMILFRWWLVFYEIV